MRNSISTAGPTGVKALLLGMSGRAKRQALVITHTAKLAEDLRRQGWRRALYQPYPALGPPSAPQPAPFRHVLMAGAARLNKGLDLVAPMLQLWTEQRRDIPLLIQVSRKHAHRHGSKEAALVDAILRCNYAALRTDDGSPDRPQYRRALHRGAGPGAVRAAPLRRCGQWRRARRAVARRARDRHPWHLAGGPGGTVWGRGHYRYADPRGPGGCRRWHLGAVGCLQRPAPARPPRCWCASTTLRTCSSG